MMTLAAIQEMVAMIKVAKYPGGYYTKKLQSLKRSHGCNQSHKLESISQCHS
jgi:hypothetical protein